MMNDVFVGLGLLGDCVNLRNPQTATLVLTGYYDDLILRTFYWLRTGDAPANDEHKTNLAAMQALENAKAHIRGDIEYVIRMADAAEKEAKRQELGALRMALRETNKPLELGTVSEIALRYNISKSEVRRRKAAGATLPSHFKAEKFP